MPRAYFFIITAVFIGKISWRSFSNTKRVILSQKQFLFCKSKRLLVSLTRSSIWLILSQSASWALIWVQFSKRAKVIIQFWPNNISKLPSIWSNNLTNFAVTSQKTQTLPESCSFDFVIRCLEILLKIQNNWSILFSIWISHRDGKIQSQVRLDEIQKSDISNPTYWK